ncbi:MAG: GNAT family N-acetyltransferase [Pyrinomonadaceae bacterium]|nr:GNAT family N-acetyltransferase [Pyrinomonadaceae bacterium]
MAVLKKIRSRLFSVDSEDDQCEAINRTEKRPALVAPFNPSYFDVRPLTVAHLDECWQLDQRCFVDGEAYSRDTFEYLLTAPESVSYRAVTPEGAMVGFVVGLVEPDRTGHITTVGVAPEYRRRRIAHKMMGKTEEAFHRRGVQTLRLEVRSTNAGAQALYANLGFVVTQRLPRYYSNGGDGLLMIKALEQ